MNSWVTGSNPVRRIKPNGDIYMKGSLHRIFWTSAGLDQHYKTKEKPSNGREAKNKKWLGRQGRKSLRQALKKFGEE